MVKKVSYLDDDEIDLKYDGIFIVDELIKDGAWLIYIDENGKKHRSVVQLHGLGEDDDEGKPLWKVGQKIRIKTF